MKGKYLEGKDHHANNLFTNMHQNFKNHNQQQPPLQTHHFHLSQTSQEQESSVDRTDTRTRTKDVFLPGPAAATTSCNDGDTIEVVRRPRGRPPGSKNKPKPPIIITHQSDQTGMMNPYLFQIPTGLDLIHSITEFSQKRSTAVCLLSATGPVSNVTLRQPTAAATVTFQGRFDILSLSATVFPSPTTTTTSSLRGNEFRISLGGPQGQVVGGTVVGPLFAAGTVYVVAASFNNPSFHRLPLEEEELSGSGGNNEGRSLSPPVGYGGGDGGRGAAAVGEACGVPFYSGGRLGEDVVWAPVARPPPPPHY